MHIIAQHAGGLVQALLRLHGGALLGTGCLDRRGNLKACDSAVPRLLPAGHFEVFFCMQVCIMLSPLSNLGWLLLACMPYSLQTYRRIRRRASSNGRPNMMSPTRTSR